MDKSVHEVSKILLDVMDKVAEISGASGEGGQLEPGGMKSNADMFDTTAASSSTSSSSSSSSTASSPAPGQSGHGGGARERDHSEYLVLREDYSHRPRKGSHFYCLRTLQTLCYTPIKCWSKSMTFRVPGMDWAECPWADPDDSLFVNY